MNGPRSFMPGMRDAYTLRSDIAVETYTATVDPNGNWTARADGYALPVGEGRGKRPDRVASARVQAAVAIARHKAESENWQDFDGKTLRWKVK